MGVSISVVVYWTHWPYSVGIVGCTLVYDNALMGVFCSSTILKSIEYYERLHQMVLVIVQSILSQ